MSHRSRPGPAPAARYPGRRWLATLCLIAAPLHATRAVADEEAERALLRQSWAQACGHYDEAVDWTARQACNLAWFRLHEKDVWRHNLNPHGMPARPSS